MRTHDGPGAGADDGADRGGRGGAALGRGMRITNKRSGDTQIRLLADDAATLVAAVASLLILANCVTRSGVLEEAPCVSGGEGSVVQSVEEDAETGTGVPSSESVTMDVVVSRHSTTHAPSTPLTTPQAHALMTDTDPTSNDIPKSTLLNGTTESLQHFCAASSGRSIVQFW